MKIQCPKCETVYLFDGSKIPPKGAHVKCKKCEHRIYVPGVLQTENGDGQDLLSDAAVIEKYIKGKNEDDILKSLYAAVIEFAGKKSFTMAAKLRDKLIELVPMALTEILETGEVIEKEKMAAMDMESLKPWANLFEAFTEKETVDFYFSLQQFKIKANRSLYEQGDYGSRLYFIRSGSFKLSYYDTERKENVAISSLVQGDITGGDTFFSFTNHTTTLTSIEESGGYFLERSDFEKIFPENPAIESKLFDYCKKHTDAFNIKVAGEQARRSFERHQISMNAHVKTLDHEGKPQGAASSVTILDISLGGLCYEIQNISSKAAETLHGSWVNIKASYKKDETVIDFNEIAKIVSVRILPFEGCNIHVKFKKSLTEEKLKEMI